ncbi:MAG: hypothetical protein V8T87_15985 [Victivallales bacterium]
MKKWSMLALLSCLVLNAAEPEIYFSFYCSARADFGGEQTPVRKSQVREMSRG